MSKFASKKNNKSTVSTNKKGANKAASKKAENNNIIILSPAEKIKKVNDLLGDDVYKGIVDILTNQAELAAYVASSVSSNTDGGVVNNFILTTPYELDDDELEAWLVTISDSIESLKMNSNSKISTRLKKFIETICVGVTQHGEYYEKANVTLSQIAGEVFAEIDCSSDDAKLIGAILAISSAICDIDRLIEDDEDSFDNTKEFSAKKDQADAPKSDASIEGAINSITGSIIEKYMNVFISLYGESCRDVLAASIQHAVAKVVTGSTDAADAVQKPDKFIESHEMEILGQVKIIMANGGPNAEVVPLDPDSIRRLMVAIFRESLSSRKTSLISGLMSLVPEKVLTIMVDSFDSDAVEQMKNVLSTFKCTQEDIDDAIEDDKHPIRIAASKVLERTNTLGIIDKIRDFGKRSIVDFVTESLSSVIDTHVSLTEKEIDEFAENFIDSVLQINVGCSHISHAEAHTRAEAKDEVPDYSHLSMPDIMSQVFEKGRNK